MESKKISVIIPIYNTANYLERCLNSVLNNTYKNLEIICVNDGSTDNSLSILTEIADLDKRIKIINKVNEGVSVARNTALDCVTGDFISFVDSDDWIHPKFFETLIYYYSKNNSRIVACKYEHIDEYKKFDDFSVENLDVCKMDKKQILSHHIARKYITARIFEAELLKKIRFDKTMVLSEDNVFSFQAIGSMLDDETLTFVDKVMYFYYNNHESAFHTLPTVEYFKSVNWYLKNIDEYENNYFKRALLDQSYKNIFWCRYAGMFDRNCSVIENNAKVYLKECKKYRYLLSKKERIIYFFFSNFPFLYRYFRIITDRTMLDWERQLKKNATN